MVSAMKPSRHHIAAGATVLALRGESGLRVSPPWDEPVPAGSTLYYVAAGRIDGARLGV